MRECCSLLTICCFSCQSRYNTVCGPADLVQMLRFRNKTRVERIICIFSNMTFFPPLKEAHTIQKTQRVINFLKVSFSHFSPVCMESSQNTALDSTDFCFKNTFWYTRGPGGWRPYRLKSGEHFNIWEGEPGKLLKRDFMQLGLTSIRWHIQTAGTSDVRACPAE